jgi:ABC-type uncharacterized transport system involved in gliding motility auxiliary subunit
MNRKTIIDLAGGLGVVLLVAGLYVFSIKSQFTHTAGWLVLAGALLALVYIALNYKGLLRISGRRGTKYRGTTAVVILVVVALLGMANFLANRHHHRFDFTSGGAYSLSSQTVKLLGSLQKDVTVISFVRDKGMEQEMKDLVAEYTYHSSRLHAEFYDINKKPALAKKYGVEHDGTMVVVCGDRTEKIAEEPTEEKLTNMLLKVTRAGRKTIYFCEGHDERDLNNQTENGYSTVKKELEDENYVVKKLLLVREGRVPDDCAVLVVAGPQKEYAQMEKDAIQSYLNVNGKALFMVDPQLPGLADLLAKWQVAVGNDIIVDVNPVGRAFGTSEFMPVGMNYEPHKITEDFKAATLFPLARSVRSAKEAKEGVEVKELVKTSDQSWAETKLNSSTVAFNEKEDLKGPVSIAVAVTSKERDRKDPEEMDSTKNKTAGDKPAENQTRLVIVGDSDFGSNSYISFSGNKDFFLNIISWLAEEEDQISVRPKEKMDRRVFLTLEQSRIIFWLTVLLSPLVVLVIGVWVWAKRRK